MPALVYLVTGFLDSGKTTLIKQSLEDPEFQNDPQKTLILRFEEGEVGYEDEWLKSHNAHLETYAIEDFNKEIAANLQKEYQPKQIFIEWNGLTSPDVLFQMVLPKDWVLVQIITTIDASTFKTYMANLKSYMFEIIKFTQVIIFNRVDNIEKRFLRNSIKAIQKNAQIVYLNKNYEVESFSSSDLPFDINSDCIDISNDDYGLWYMDALENPSRYNHKRVIIRGKYLEKIDSLQRSIVLGRYAMVCCADDMQPIALTITGVDTESLKLNNWYAVTGELRTVTREDQSQTLVLYTSKIEKIQAPEDEYVNFN